MTDLAAPSRLARLVDLRGASRAVASRSCSRCMSWSGPRCRRCLSHNLQLDLAEDLALGREWQLGYWKHPPLPWWLADLAYRVAGDVRAVYLLGPVSAAVCMYARVAARPRHRRRLPGADRGAGARRPALLQFLGAEIRARPDAAAVLGADRPVPLSGDRARARARLARGRRRARALLLVEIRRLRARRQPRPVHAARRRPRGAAC